MRGETRRKARRRIRRRSIAARIAAKTTGAAAQGAGYHPRPKAEPPKAVARGVGGRDPEHRAELPRVPCAACFAAASGYPPKRSGVAEGDVNQGCGTLLGEADCTGLDPEVVYVYGGNRRLSVVSAVR